MVCWTPIAMITWPVSSEVRVWGVALRGVELWDDVIFGEQADLDHADVKGAAFCTGNRLGHDKRPVHKFRWNLEKKRLHRKRARACQRHSQLAMMP